MRFITVLLAAICCLAGQATAQSVSGHTGAGALRVNNVLVNIANLSAQYNDNMAEIQKMQICMGKNMFYAPAAPDADSDGCSKEVDPKIGDANDKLYPDSLCQSTDGKTVTCPTLDQSKILTVMSEAWGTGATRTVSVSCPSDSLRLGCAGARGLDSSGNMVDDCDESTCGLVGVVAISNNGCETTARVDGASADEPVVYATCLSLTGSYTPPPNPTGPAACNLPWGGTIASGGSVTAYRASTGSPCQSQTRTCTNGTLSGSYTYAACTAAAVNGVCGPAGGTSVGSAPTSGLCSAGTATAVSGSGPWNWKCNGTNGGTDAACSATKSRTWHDMPHAAGPCYGGEPTCSSLGAVIGGTCTASYCWYGPLYCGDVNSANAGQMNCH